MAIRPQIKKLTSLVTIHSNGMEQQPAKAERPKSSSNAATWLWKRRPHVALEWNVSQDKVVSKPDQVGISRRHLSSFSELGCRSSGLADVISVPHELFDLNDLKDVLSLEAWNVCLSDSEREFLCELLPKNVDKEAVVHSLLCGDNFHFGNPLLSWGASLCVGDAHPDAVYARDTELKKSQKAYYSDVQSYHDKLFADLTTLKEIWISCNSSESEFSAKLQTWTAKRALENAKKSVVETLLHSQANKREVNETSSVLVEREVQMNGCKSDVAIMNEDLHPRQRKRRKIGSLQESLEKAAAVSIDGTKRHTPVPCSSSNGDFSTEIMCTLKVNCKQYAEILNLKQAGEDLCLDSLSSILGTSHNLGIHCLSTFDEIDTQKIHECWSNLVEDIPAAYTAFLERQAHKIKTAKSLAQQSLHRRSQLFLKRAACNADFQARVAGSTKLMTEEQLHQFNRLAVAYTVSSPPSPSRIKWPGKHNIEGLAHQTNSKGDTSLQQQVSASDSSCTVSKITDSAKSLKPIVNRQSPPNEQVLQLQTLSPSPQSIQNSEVPTFLQVDTSGMSSISAVESEAFLKHRMQVYLSTHTGRDNLAITEAEVMNEDDEVPAIKTTWSSAHLEEQELHSENSAMPNVKESGTFFGRKGSSIWESHVKPVTETLTIGPIRGGVARDEVEQGKDFRYQCTGLDARLLGTESLPGFPSREQFSGFPQGNSFLVQQNFLSNGHGYCNQDSRTYKQGSQHHDLQQENNHTMQAGYQPMISMNINDIPQPNEVSLRQSQPSEMHNQLFQTGQDRSQNQLKQQMLLPKFLSPESHSERFLGLCSNLDHTKLVSPVHTLQSRARQSGLSETSQAMIHMPLLSESERSKQYYGPSVKELQLLADSGAAEQLGHFRHPELVHFRSQTELAEHHPQMLGHHQQHVNQSFPLHQELQQSQEHQHSTQDFFSPSASSSILTGWADAQQVSSGRTATANSASHFTPSTGHWNNGDESLQINWPQMEAVSGLFLRGKNEDKKSPSPISHWDQVSQNGFVVDTGLQKHGHYLGNARAFNGGSYASTDDCRGFRGQDDWTSMQQFLSNHQYGPSSDRSVVYKGQPIPWFNLPPAGHIPHQLSNYEQQSLQDRGLSKTSSHLGTSFDYC